LLVLLALSSMLAEADDFQIIPSLAVREEYNDNIFFTEKDGTDDFITTISPGLKVIERTERFDGNLSAIVAPFFYSHNSDLNDTNQFYRGSLDYQLSPRLNFGANGGFTIDYRPDRDLDVTGLVVTPRERRWWRGGGDLSYQLTPITTGSLSYQYENVKYDGQNYIDYDTHSAVASLSRDLSYWLDSTVGTLSFGYQRYSSDTADNDSVYATLGGRHQFSERLSLDTALGGRYTDSSFDRVRSVLVPPGVVQSETVSKDTQNFGALGQAALNYHWEKTYGTLGFLHDLRPANGSVGIAQRTEVTVNLRHLIYHNLRIGLFSGYFLNKADRDKYSANDIDLTTFSIRPSLRWEFYDNFTLEGAYTFNHQIDDVDDTKIDRNVVWLQVAYGLPLFDILDFFGGARSATSMRDDYTFPQR
jgi:hypothetical protein